MFIFIWTRASWYWWEVAAASFFIKTDFFMSTSQLSDSRNGNKSTSLRSYWNAIIHVLRHFERLIISKDCTKSIHGSLSGKIWWRPMKRHRAEAAPARRRDGPPHTQPQRADRRLSVPADPNESWTRWRRFTAALMMPNRLETQHAAPQPVLLPEDER